MADDESPLVRDIRISDAGIHLTNEDSISHTNLFHHDGKFNLKTIFYELFIYSFNSSNG